MEMQHVYLPDSWVLAVETDATRVCFVLEAVLTPEHPRYYSPPKSGEQYAYARMRWCLRGEVHWNDGPNLDRPATDATGGVDFGNIYAWFEESGVDHIEGEWGAVTVRNALHSVEYLDPPR
ncbi:MAG: hypothetical protein ACK5CE_16965 [Actinomycetes bacterium]|jgi:hypothetical protein|uniref:Unannotated protein n=1 Tax=freshwater metagenome TaxID=449393 RepID=A0A6J6EK43_9ZZZZ|nr:hypothetical protein [Actinomycetota bacterium]